MRMLWKVLVGCFTASVESGQIKPEDAAVWDIVQAHDGR